MKATTYFKMLSVVKPSALRGFNANQIIKLIPTVWRMSWGFNSPAIALETDKADKSVNLDAKILMFKVRGALHKGYVMICLNGSDLFDAYYFTTQGNLKKETNDLYFDQLAEILDANIETRSPLTVS